MADPNNVYLPDQKIVLLCICKAANTSIKRTFMNALGIEHINPHSREVFEYISDREAIHALPDSEWLKIAVVRHPRDRFISCFKQKVWRPLGLHSGFKRKGCEPIKWKMPFADFLEFVARTPDEISEQHFRSQSYDLFLDDQTPIPNLWGRIESLHKDWEVIREKVFAHCGLRLGRMGRAANSSAKIKVDCSMEWTGRLKTIHHKRFERDFRLLNYDAT